MNIIKELFSNLLFVLVLALLVALLIKESYPKR